MNNNFKKEKGAAILYVVFISGIVLAIVLGISGILTYQVRMLTEVGYSVVAFYAADAGIESILIGDRENPSSICTKSLPCNLDIDGKISYYLEVIDSSSDPRCDEDKYSYCIRSVGAYQGVKRAIEIAY